MIKRADKLSHHRLAVMFVLLALVVYVVVPQLGNFHDSWSLISHARPAWLLLAASLTFATFFAAAATYRLLSFKLLPYSQLVLVELAAMFINRLLPAGIGALGANFGYLRHRHNSSAQAGSIIAVNNLLGVTGHMGILLITLAPLHSHIKLDKFWHRPVGWQMAAAIGIVCLAVAGLIYLHKKQKLATILRGSRAQLASYKTQPQRLIGAQLSSLSLTMCNLMCLAACGASLGLGLSFSTLLIVFSFGVGLASLTPTPGGLGGFEAGLASSLVAYHVPAASALALALLYRLVSYWLPLVGGGLAFITCQRRHLFTA